MPTSRKEELQQALATLDELKIPEPLRNTALSYLLNGGQAVTAQPVSEQAIPTPEQTTQHSSPVKEASELRAFLVQHNVPHRAVHEIPCLTYWGREQEGKDSVNDQILWELYKVAGRKPPENIPQSLRDLSAKRYGWLESVKGKTGHYRLSRAGEIHVLHELRPSGTKRA